MDNPIQIPLWAAVLVPVLSGIGGALVTGTVSLWITDRSITAEGKRLKIRLYHERIEARKERIALERSRWLAPLKLAIAGYATSIGRLAFLFSDYQSAIRSGATPSIENTAEKLRAGSDALNNLQGGVTEFRFQGSDDSLDELLDELSPKIEDVAVEINSIADKHIKSKTDEERAGLSADLKARVTEMAHILIPINKRIEILAAGSDLDD